MIVLLTSLFAVLGIALLLVQQRILLPGFAELEREGARTDLDRVKNTLKRDLDLPFRDPRTHPRLQICSIHPAGPRACK